MNRTFARNAIRALVMGFAALAVVPQAAYVVRLESPDSPAAVALLEDAAGREGIRLTATAQGVLRVYNYWPEAEYARRQFAERLGLGLKVAATTDPAALGPMSGDAYGLEPVIRTDVASVDAAPDYSLEDRGTSVSDLERLIADAPDKAAAVTLLSEQLLATPPTDALHGWLLVKRGIAHLGKGDHVAAIGDFQRVAGGKVAATREDRVKAMRRIAWCLHQQDKRVEAYKAYDELQQFSRSDLTRATALVEKCGLIIELARSEKGTLDDAQAAIRAALEVIPAELKRQRGTLALMDLECDYWQGRFAETVQKADQWLATYGDQLRDKAMCLNFAGLACHKMKNPERGDHYLLAILELPDPTSDEDRFATKGERWDTKERALRWLYAYAQQRNDTEKMALYRDMLAARTRKGVAEQ